MFSKQLFLTYINTHCKSVLGIPFTETLLVWYRNSVETLESNYCYWRRNRIRHYDEYTNSTHEGTNNALKHRAGAVQPNLKLKNAVAKISFFANVDGNRRKSHVAYEYRTKSTCSNQNISDWLTIPCDNILSTLENIKHKYVVFRNGLNTWLCTRCPEHPKEVTNCKYPVFKRIRTIIYNDGKISCSCPFQYTYGIPCVHLLKVLSSIDEYPGLTHHDFSVSWWKLYHLNIFKDDIDDLNQDSNISNDYYKLLSYLKSNETNGISIDRHIINGLPLYNGPLEKLYVDVNSGISC